MKSHTDVGPAWQDGKKLPVLYNSSSIVFPASPHPCSRVCSKVGLGFGFDQETALMLCFCLAFL